MSELNDLLKSRGLGAPANQLDGGAKRATKDSAEAPKIQGVKFGRLTAVTFLGLLRLGRDLRRRAVWECCCDCGSIVQIRESHLRSGNTKSCGCVSRKLQIAGVTKHGLSRGKCAEYGIWVSMRDRCNNANSSAYKNYGGRGIVVCERWNDFKLFLSDMGHRPTSSHTIERRDNDSNYSPANCEWATRKTQSNNMRRNRLLTFNGETRNLTQWAETLGLPAHALACRIHSGWPVERALTQPFMRRNRHGKSL